MLSEKMNVVKVSGKNNRNKILMYSLSTCVWCKMTKQFLKDNNVEYEYVDVDMCNETDKTEIKDDILKRGVSLNYPTLIIDDRILISGFRKQELKEALGI